MPKTDDEHFFKLNKNALIITPKLQQVEKSSVMLCISMFNSCSNQI